MKKVGKKLIGILMIGVMLSASNISLAITQQEIDNQKNEQKKVENEKKQVENEKDKVTQEKKAVQEQVDKLNNQIDSYQNQISDLESKIEDANKKIAEQEVFLKQAQEDYEKQQKTLEERLVAIYEAGETTYLDVLLSSESVTDFISNYYVVSQIAECDLEMLQKIDNQKKQIEQAKQEIENGKNELTTAKASKESVSKELQTAKKEKDSQVANLSKEEQDLQKEIDELSAVNRKIAGEIADAQKKYQEQIDKLKPPVDGGSNGGSSSAGSGFFMRPVSGGTISTNGYYSWGGFHGAIDYAIPSGSSVYAAADGVVLKTANLTNSYGTYVVIQHAGNLQTWYGHGTYGSICVTPGQTVKKGQVIMKSGSTGNSSGPHLHFEVRKSPYNYNGSAKAYGQDSRVNPNNYF